MEIKVKSYDEFPLNKTIKISSMIIVDKAAFHENSKHYPQFVLDEDEYLYELRIV